MVKLVGDIVKKCGEEYLPTLDDLKPICLETEGRVLGEEKKSCSGFSLCPYTIAKTVLSTPILMGSAILAAGVVLGMALARDLRLVMNCVCA